MFAALQGALESIGTKGIDQGPALINLAMTLRLGPEYWTLSTPLAQIVHVGLGGFKISKSTQNFHLSHYFMIK